MANCDRLVYREGLQVQWRDLRSAMEANRTKDTDEVIDMRDKCSLEPWLNW
jgi:hypothetical protein